ncbi:unnamed protein product [Linum trigynum]|uniref:Pentatricopeptide repeat-containing protein n=1 Tax=Linum trigynum TaxID=586398 RepID=A0AAV2EKY2_9ROSI
MNLIPRVLSRKLCSRCSSYSTSSFSWISPLQDVDSVKDPPPKTHSSLLERRRRSSSKFISHDSAVTLIQAERDPQLALELFNRVGDQDGFNHNHATHSTILHKLAQSRKFDAVHAVLHQMTYETCEFHENVFLDLMNHFSKSMMHDRVVEMFYAIQKITRVKPSLKAVTTCLNLLIESQQVGLARSFLVNVKKHLDLRPNTCIFNILVKHHCKVGDLESAQEVMKEMKRSKLSYPNLVTYSTLMDGLCRHGRLKDATDLFEEMVSEHQIVPDALTYNVLINGFVQSGRVDRARKIIEFMKSNGCTPNLFNYSTLMNGFCKEGKVTEAKEAFQEMKTVGLRPDTVGYTTLINCLCRSRRSDEALVLLQEMKETQCRPDVVTYNVLLRGLCEEGRFGDALGMLKQTACEGVYLNKGSYRIVLNCLLKRGELEKAAVFLGVMLDKRYLPHYATSNELLAKLCEEDRAYDAEMALFRLAEAGFKPGAESWGCLVELVCRERKLLAAFELLDSLAEG